jgi:chromosome segregation ATPase
MEDNWKSLYEQSEKDLFKLQDNFLHLQHTCEDLQSGYDRDIVNLKKEISQLNQEKDARFNEVFKKDKDHQTETSRLKAVIENQKETISNLDKKIVKLTEMNAENEMKAMQYRDSMNVVLEHLEKTNPKPSKGDEKGMSNKIIVEIRPKLEIYSYQEYSPLESALESIEKAIHQQSQSGNVKVKQFKLGSCPFSFGFFPFSRVFSTTLQHRPFLQMIPMKSNFIQNLSLSTEKHTRNSVLDLSNKSRTNPRENLNPC